MSLAQCSCPADRATVAIDQSVEVDGSFRWTAGKGGSSESLNDSYLAFPARFLYFKGAIRRVYPAPNVVLVRLVGQEPCQLCELVFV